MFVEVGMDNLNALNYFVFVLYSFQIAAPEIAMIKASVPDVACKIIDRAIQVSTNRNASGNICKAQSSVYNSVLGR